MSPSSPGRSPGNLRIRGRHTSLTVNPASVSTPAGCLTVFHQKMRMSGIRRGEYPTTFETHTVVAQR